MLCMCVLHFMSCCRAVTVKSVAGLCVSICSCCCEMQIGLVLSTVVLREVKKERGVEWERASAEKQYRRKESKESLDISLLSALLLNIFPSLLCKLDKFEF